MKAVLQNGRALKHAAEELKGDKEMVAQLVAKDASALRFAAKELRSGELLSSNGRALDRGTKQKRRPNHVRIF